MFLSGLKTRSFSRRRISYEAQQILEEADKDKSGTIDFEEFIHGLENHLNRILADVSTEVQYVNVPKATALYDLMTGGLDENTANFRLDLLSLLNPLRWFDIPPELNLEVPLSHPRYEWFEEFGLQWYSLPAVSNMAFDIGGIQYTCAPFNGFYMGTEIGGRNFSDAYRYNMLPVIAQKMGLDMSDDSTLWKDSALVELNIAVVYSYKKHGVRLLDHHSMGDYYMKFMEEEQKCQRSVYSDWVWIIPPISGSTSPAWQLEMENRILKPNYFYQPDPWKTASEKPEEKCPYHNS